MNAYVWTNVGSGLTGNYHDGGGALVIAEDEETAMAALVAKTAPARAEWDAQEAWEIDQPMLLGRIDGDPCVIIFPDAGCC